MVLLHQKNQKCVAKSKNLFYTPSILSNIKRKNVYIHSINDQWQADLVDMQQYKSENNNFEYVFTVIDWFRKYAWCIASKDKTSKETNNALTDLSKNKIC